MSRRAKRLGWNEGVKECAGKEYAASEDLRRLKKMDTDSSSSDEEKTIESKPMNAFDVLMAPLSKKAKVNVDPIYIAVIYIRWLKWIDPSEPLYMCPYTGAKQAVRVGKTAEEVAVARWKYENADAKSKNRRVGLLRELKVHGPGAVVEWKRGPRSEVQAWASVL